MKVTRAPVLSRSRPSSITHRVSLSSHHQTLRTKYDPVQGKSVQDSSVGRALVVSSSGLTPAVVEELGGPAAAAFCEGKATALLRAPRPSDADETRVKRQSSINYVPPQGRMSDDEYAVPLPRRRRDWV